MSAFGGMAHTNGSSSSNPSQLKALNSLRDHAVHSLTNMLNLNSNSSSSTTLPTWKVLILDSRAQDVLATTLRVQDLRDNGVTLHMQLHSDRPALPDVPAVYFISPTSENIKRVAEDLGKSLYEATYVNFTSPLPRSLLEEFAHLVAANGSVSSIEQVFDQYLDFVVLEPFLFSLSPSPSASKETPRTTYELLHSSKSKEEDIDGIVDRVAGGLFSVLATLGQLPIIRCPRGNAAEMVARKLDSRLRDHVASKGGNLFSGNNESGFQRPVLIILDRNIDLVPMLSHSWTYQALVNDVLEMKLNRITVQVRSSSDYSGCTC